MVNVDGYNCISFDWLIESIWYKQGKMNGGWITVMKDATKTIRRHRNNQTPNRMIKYLIELRNVDLFLTLYKWEKGNFMWNFISLLSVNSTTRRYHASSLTRPLCMYMYMYMYYVCVEFKLTQFYVDTLLNPHLWFSTRETDQIVDGN